MRRGRVFARALAVATAAALAGGGCGIMVDTAYWSGSKRYHESVEERAPTAESRTAVEYDAVAGPDGRLHLVCEARTRGIERSWAVHKTFERRGSYDKSTYSATAFLSGLTAAIIGVSFGAACAKDDLDVSCWNLAYATPFVLDMGWSLVRRARARPAKLVDKSKSGDRLVVARAPLAATPVACDDVAEVVVGQATGTSEEAELNGATRLEPRRVVDGALALGRDPDGALALGARPDVITLWAGHPYMSLWVVDRAGTAHAVKVDRCTALRPHVMVLTGPALATYQRDCPPPRPPGQ